MSFFHECSLQGGDEIVQVGPKLINQNLCYNFVIGSTEVKWPEVIRCGRNFNLRYKAKKSPTPRGKDFPGCKDTANVLDQ